MQLKLFPEHEIAPINIPLTESANLLLKSLNEDLKEHYRPQYTFQHKGLTVLIVANSSKDVLCNVLDKKGKTPFGFSANWRTPAHIKQELKLE